MTEKAYQLMPDLSRRPKYRPETDAAPAARRMSGAEYLALIKKFNLTQWQAATFFGVSVRTGERWAAAGPPPGVVIALRIMDHQKMDPREVEHIMRVQKSAQP